MRQWWWWLGGLGGRNQWLYWVTLSVVSRCTGVGNRINSFHRYQVTWNINRSNKRKRDRYWGWTSTRFNWWTIWGAFDESCSFCLVTVADAQNKIKRAAFFTSVIELGSPMFFFVHLTGLISGWALSTLPVSRPAKKRVKGVYCWWNGASCVWVGLCSRKRNDFASVMWPYCCGNV